MSKQEGVEETPPVANQNNEAQIAQAAAIQRIDACLAQAQTTGSNLLAWAETAGQLCASANKSVTDVLGADAHDSMIPPRPSASANPAEPAQEDTSKEPVLAQVRNMYRAWYRMDEIAVEATALREEVAAASAAARATPSETLNQQATAFGGRIQALATGAKADESRGKLASIRADLTTVSNMVLVIRKRLIREAGQARQQAELEKQKQEAEKREAARQTKIGSEIAEITAKEAEIKGLLHKQNYHDARWQLRTVYSPLMEEESRKAYAVATQRVARIEELRDFIVAHVSGYQHPDGWTIESADKNSLVVRNKMGTNVVAWADVGDVRIVLFIRHLLMDEEMSRNLKLREHVRMLVAAALYCRKVVPENKNAQDLADKMLEKAVSLLPDAKDDIALLLPAGPKTDSDKPTGDKPADETAAK